MEIVTIRTPQFKGGTVDRFHIQKGTIDKKTWVFSPLNNTNGDHPVRFKNEQDFKSAEWK